MPNYESGHLRFKHKDGSTYTIDKPLRANTAHEALQERQRIIDKEKAKGNSYSGGGSVRQKNR